MELSRVDSWAGLTPDVAAWTDVYVTQIESLSESLKEAEGLGEGLYCGRPVSPDYGKVVEGAYVTPRIATVDPESTIRTVMHPIIHRFAYDDADTTQFTKDIQKHPYDRHEIGGWGVRFHPEKNGRFTDLTVWLKPLASEKLLAAKNAYLRALDKERLVGKMDMVLFEKQVREALDGDYQLPYVLVDAQAMHRVTLEDIVQAVDGKSAWTYVTADGMKEVRDDDPYAEGYGLHAKDRGLKAVFEHNDQWYVIGVFQKGNQWEVRVYPGSDVRMESQGRLAGFLQGELQEEIKGEMEWAVRRGSEYSFSLQVLVERVLERKVRRSLVDNRRWLRRVYRDFLPETIAVLKRVMPKDFHEDLDRYRNALLDTKRVGPMSQSRGIWTFEQRRGWTGWRLRATKGGDLMIAYDRRR